jgi:hypothetical protein
VARAGVGGNTTAEFKRLRRAWYAGEGDHACPTGGKLLSPCNTGPACFMGAREISSLSPISHHSLLTLVSQLHHNYIKMKKTPASSRAMILQHSQHHPNLEPSHASFCSVMYKVILLLSLCNQITHQEEKDSSVCNGFHQYMTLHHEINWRAQYSDFCWPPPFSFFHETPSW